MLRSVKSMGSTGYALASCPAGHIMMISALCTVCGSRLREIMLQYKEYGMPLFGCSSRPRAVYSGVLPFTLPFSSGCGGHSKYNHKALPTLGPGVSLQTNNAVFSSVWATATADRGQQAPA